MADKNDTYKLTHQVLKDWFDDNSPKSFLEQNLSITGHLGLKDLSEIPVCPNCKGKRKHDDSDCKKCEGVGFLLPKPSPSRIPHGKYISPGQHLVFKNPLCPKGQMQIHMHPDDYEAFKKEQESKKQSK